MEREERDRSVYEEWVYLTSVPGQSKTVVANLLMKKYNIHSVGTIYAIIKRMS